MLTLTLTSDALRCEKARLHREMSLLVLSRDGYQCVLCGSDQMLEVHEILPRSKFGRKSWRECFVIENMATLCQPCHAKAQTRPMRIRLLALFAEKHDYVYTGRWAEYMTDGEDRECANT